MRVQVGPVPSGGVGIWIAYARTVLAKVVSTPDELGVTIEPAIIESFEGYLDSWERAASAGPEFLWVTEVEPEQVEFLAKAFLAVADALARAAEERGYPISPPEGEEFYRAVVHGFVDALAQEAGARLEFAEWLRSEWPGLKPD